MMPMALIRKNMRWKINQYELYKKYGFGGNFPLFYLKEILSKNQRAKNYIDFKEYYISESVFKRFGIKLDKNTPFGTIREVFEDGIYFEWPDFVPKHGDSVLDVGAQCGDYSLLSSVYHKCSNIIAIEPLPSNYNTLLKNLKMNRVSNVIPINAAASDSSGIIEIGYESDMAFKGPSKKKIDVRGIRIDDLPMKSLDLIKIDVEGFEIEVLKGAENTIKKFNPKIILETHSTGLKEKSLRFLGNLGYEMAHEGRIVRNDDSWMDSIQNLFLQKNI